MSQTDILIETVSLLPQSLQLEVLHFAEFLVQKQSTHSDVGTESKKYRNAGCMQGTFGELSEDFDAPFTFADTVKILDFPLHHQDPFDRIIVAQTITRTL